MVDGEGPQTLYHYTTLAGLLGIIGSGNLRATDVQFLNDAQELRYGRDDLCAELQRYADDLDPPGSDPEADDGRLKARATVARSASEYLGQGKLTDQGESVYVACFCGNGDLLSQWRGYGTGGGYALGFKRAALAQLASADPNGDHGWSLSTDGSQAGAGLVRVQYGPSAVEAMCRRVVANVSPRPVGHPGSHGWAAAVVLAIPALAGVSTALSARNKSGVYSSLQSHLTQAFRRCSGPAPSGSPRTSRSQWTSPRPLSRLLSAQRRTRTFRNTLYGSS